MKGREAFHNLNLESLFELQEEQKLLAQALVGDNSELAHEEMRWLVEIQLPVLEILLCESSAATVWRKLKKSGYTPLSDFYETVRMAYEEALNPSNLVKKQERRKDLVDIGVAAENLITLMAKIDGGQRRLFGSYPVREVAAFLQADFGDGRLGRFHESLVLRAIVRRAERDLELPNLIKTNIGHKKNIYFERYLLLEINGKTDKWLDEMVAHLSSSLFNIERTESNIRKVREYLLEEFPSHIS